MLFSKTLGYAIHAILYIAGNSEKSRYIQLDEIARVLNVPRYFVGKVMNKLVKAGVIDSVKGHYGGFCINKKTLGLTIADLCDITGDNHKIDICVFQLQPCSDVNPCPFHHSISRIRNEWHQTIVHTTIEQLLSNVQGELANTIMGKHFPAP